MLQHGITPKMSITCVWAHIEYTVNRGRCRCVHKIVNACASFRVWESTHTHTHTHTPALVSCSLRLTVERPLPQLNNLSPQRSCQTQKTCFARRWATQTNQKPTVATAMLTAQGKMTPNRKLPVQKPSGPRVHSSQRRPQVGNEGLANHDKPDALTW